VQGGRWTPAVGCREASLVSEQAGDHKDELAYDSV